MGIFGDRKVSSSDGAKCEDLIKVSANDHLIAGFAGDFVPILKALQAVKEGEDDPSMLARINVDGLVMKNGRILLIDSGKIWTRRKSTQFYATGTGHAEAMAFLSGRMSTKRKAKLTLSDIAATFCYVSKVRDDCSKAFDCVE